MERPSKIARSTAPVALRQQGRCLSGILEYSVAITPFCTTVNAMWLRFPLLGRAQAASCRVTGY